MSSQLAWRRCPSIQPTLAGCCHRSALSDETSQQNQMTPDVTHEDPRWNSGFSMLYCSREVRYLYDVPVDTDAT